MPRNRSDPEELQDPPLDEGAVVDLLSEISARFIHFPTHEFDRLVTQSLRQMAETLGLEGASLTFFNKVGISSHRFPRQGSTETAVELPHATARLRNGETVVVPEEARYALPLMREKRLIGVLSLHAVKGRPRLAHACLNRLRIFSDVFAYALSKHETDLEVEEAMREVERLKSQLEDVNSHLRQQYERRYALDEIIAESASMREVLRLVETVGPTNSVVLIQGETGTGKELIARRIHSLSSRSDRPMVTVNCAALPPTLIESELFGREKGAYTGALSRQAGRFEVADRSTLFLDEVGELPLDLQVKLLRVLQEGRFERLGSTKTIEVDVRLIAATNRDLVAAVEAGEFRRDLYYRLNVFPISVAPLRERQEDIPQMAWKFAESLGQARGRAIERIPPRSMELLQAYSWPGNARELRNAVERAMILNEGPVLEIEPADGAPQAPEVERTLEEVQRDHILSTLTRTGWRIRGRGGAADQLGMRPTTLESRMSKLGIHRHPRQVSGTVVVA
ncbi:MAG TPA: sigma 54-interacting transcriptional regulator [Gemmatimonadota bacterium]|nr:sigma 54-interacting transcriptional regulator [Gemmatimonadota bacterium]